MAEYKIKLPKPYPEQQQALDEAKRFNVVAMGEGAGKTTLGIEALIASKRGAVYGKAPVGFFAATKDRLGEVRIKIMKAIDPLIKRVVSRSQIELANGNSIFFHSLDDKLDRLQQMGMLVVDDVRRVPHFMDLWLDISQALKQHDGGAWFLSDAYGKKNDFYTLYQMAEADPEFWTCRQIESLANPFLDKDLQEAAMSATDLEYDQRFGAKFLDVAIEISAASRIIGPNETFRQWCERLGREGLKVDGKPFRLDDRPAMAWIYDQIPSTQEEAYRLVLVLMKCAQVGFTIMEMLAVIYLGIKFGPATVGMFLPDTGLADIKSSKRFMPIVRTIPDVHKLMTMDALDGTGKKAGEGNVRVRQIGDAMFVFSWTSGRATTESIPMDILSFDEVQEMTLEQMEKTQERLSASPVRFTLMGSTANWPDSDIHHWYKRGSQHRFHTECENCGSKRPLDDYFPECIKFDSTTNVSRYVCKDCGEWLNDTQIGEWIPDNPDADREPDPSMPRKDWPLRIRSIHFPQFLSPTISAGEILFAYNTATDMKNFYNRKLGKPYLDPSQVPVTLEHMARCVDAGKEAGVRWESRGSGYYMGIDQMGNFNVHLIKKRLPDGRQAVVHAEETYSADPFERSAELMDLYGIAVCVVEINPNYNDAKKFANRFPGRVFICNSFGSLQEDMIKWGDAPRLDTSERRTDEEAQDRYTLRMDQYKCMQVSMSRFTAKEPHCLFPDPQGLVQEVVEKGQKQVVAILPRVFHHFTKTALVAERSEETNQYRRSVKKVGIDPHFSYANMLCDVAWSRAHGTSTFIMPDVEPEKKADPRAVVIPSSTVSAVEAIKVQQVAEDTCGKCRFRDPATSRCSELQAFVRPSDPGCLNYESRGY